MAETETAGAASGAESADAGALIPAPAVIHPSRALRPAAPAISEAASPYAASNPAPTFRSDEPAAPRSSRPSAAETEELAFARTAVPITPKSTEPALALLRIPRIVPPPLRGSRESLIRQNEKSEAEGLERIEDSADLRDRIAHRLLIPVPASSALIVNANLPEQYRYCRPWTAKFLADLAHAHDAVFHRPILVSSAVRTIEYQKQLERVNGNAAPAEGDIVSPHLTGGTIDIAKGVFTRQEIGWMRAWLKPLQTAGKIDVEEEFLQACFHITVYANYVPPPRPAPKTRPRRRTPSVATALAAKVM